MGQLSQAPERGQDGSHLNAVTTSGGKLMNVIQGASTLGSITLNASGDAGGLDYGYFDYSLIVYVDNVFIPFSKCLPFQTTQIWVGGTTDPYLLDSGASETTFKVLVHQRLRTLADSNSAGYTHDYRASFKNNSTGVITVYFQILWRFIVAT